MGGRYSGRHSAVKRIQDGQALNGTVMPPDAPTAAPQARLRLGTLEGCRISAAKITRLSIEGKLDVDAAVRFVVLIEKVASMLRMEAENAIILARVAELEAAATSADVSDILSDLRTRIKEA
jgi:hypothetical protein